MRVIGGGRDLHPFHHHGNHAPIIAKDGRLLASDGSADPDLAQSGVHHPVGARSDRGCHLRMDGQGPGLGHLRHAGRRPTRPQLHRLGTATALTDRAIRTTPIPYEYCADHGKPFPTVLPEKQDLAFGGWYGGSPFLGAAGALPPGEGGLNPNGGFSYMWHSHTEKELTNYDIFPGGMLTMLIIESWNVDDTLEREG